MAASSSNAAAIPNCTVETIEKIMKLSTFPLKDLLQLQKVWEDAFSKETNGRGKRRHLGAFPESGSTVEKSVWCITKIINETDVDALKPLRDDWSRIVTSQSFYDKFPDYVVQKLVEAMDPYRNNPGDWKDASDKVVHEFLSNIRRPRQLLPVCMHFLAY